MIPSSFPETNRILLKPEGTDKDIDTLSVFSDGERCISLWKPTLKERLSILLFGNVWLDVMSGKTQPPVTVSGSRKYFELI